MKEAMLYEKLSDNRVRCDLCAHRCIIAQGKKGICGVRENRGGTLYTLVYGRTIAQHVDTVEKKPLFHFYPGSTAYFIATLQDVTSAVNGARTGRFPRCLASSS
jgi:pyruvate formate lyase activating enzyme